MLRNFLTVDRLVADFEQNFREHYFEKWGRVDWTRLSLQECWEAWHELSRRFLYRWQAPLVTDFCAMLFVGKLKELTVKWGLDPEGGLQNDLLCGEGGIESTEPTRFLMRLAAVIRTDPVQREWLAGTRDADCLTTLEARPDLAPLLA
jgi:pyruvate,water dikinase